MTVLFGFDVARRAVSFFVKFKGLIVHFVVKLELRTAKRAVVHASKSFFEFFFNFDVVRYLKFHVSYFDMRMFHLEPFC